MIGRIITTTTFGIATTLALGIAGSASAETLLVPDHYERIQDAIDAAQPDDEIRVAAGTYAERIDFRGKPIRVIGAGADTTTIDASTVGGSVVTFDEGETADALLRGFTLRGGSGTYYSFRYSGGGIYIYNANPTIESCVLRDNVADTGAGLFGVAFDGVVADCRFESNVAGQTGQGGGGAFVRISYPTFVRTAFTNNVSGSSGGGLMVDTSNAVVRSCAFTGNSATFGGGMANLGSDAIVANCTFVSNAANLQFPTNGGGLRNVTGTEAVIENSIFWGNVPSEIIDTWGVNSIVSHSIVEGGWDGAGESNLDVDPMLDPFLRPAASSPAIDAGNNDVVPEGDADLVGNPRIQDGDGDALELVDLGAFELEGMAPPPCRGDRDGDGLVGFGDLVAVLNDWGLCPEGSDPCNGDANDDGMVGFDDLTIVLVGWGPCP